MKSSQGKELWVLVYVEAGIIANVGVYNNLKVARNKMFVIKRNMRTDEDDLQLIGPFKPAENKLATG